MECRAAIFGKKWLRRSQNIVVLEWHIDRETFRLDNVDVSFPKDFTFLLRTFYLSVAAMSFKTRKSR